MAKEFIIKNGFHSKGDSQITGSLTADSFVGDGSTLTGLVSSSYSATASYSENYLPLSMSSAYTVDAGTNNLTFDNITDLNLNASGLGYINADTSVQLRTSFTRSHYTIIAASGPDGVGMYLGDFAGTKLGGIEMYQNDTASVSGTTITPNYPTAISTQNYILSQSIVNTVMLGGQNIYAKTSNTAYTNQVGFNNGGAFETLLTHTSASADNSQSLQDASGIIALTSDINSITGSYLPLAGGSMSGDIEVGSNKITSGVGEVTVSPNLLTHTNGTNTIGFNSNAGKLSYIDGGSGAVGNLGMSSISTTRTWIMPDEDGTVALKVIGVVSGSSQISYNGITDVPSNIVSSSAQISTDISGSFTEASGGFSTRITTIETTPAGLWTGSATEITRESDVQITGSLAVSESIKTNNIKLASDGETTAKIEFSGSYANNLYFEVENSGSIAIKSVGSGSLWTITDSLSGSLHSINNVSGLPILEVFSDDKVVMGQFGKDTVLVDGSNVTLGSNDTSGSVSLIGRVNITGSLNGDGSGLTGITSTYVAPTIETGSVISWRTKEIYNTNLTPVSGNFTDDVTGAQYGIVQKIYHNLSGSAPTFPAGWVLVGDGVYFDNQLNIVYAEWAGGSRVEYWIIQEA